MEDTLVQEKHLPTTPIDDIITPKKKYFIETYGC